MFTLNIYKKIKKVSFCLHQESSLCFSFIFEVKTKYNFKMSSKPGILLKHENDRHTITLLGVYKSHSFRFQLRFQRFNSTKSYFVTHQTIWVLGNIESSAIKDFDGLKRLSFFLKLVQLIWFSAVSLLSFFATFLKKVQVKCI